MTRSLRCSLAVLTALAIWGGASPAGAQAPSPAKPQTASLDSEAPPGAPPHWLPGEQWVMQHWLPYDETRLYRLLGIRRGDVWRWLRDDTRNLAGLARSRGWEPQRLAEALVAPWRADVRDPQRLALLERRALRTLTQGHLAQHLFFHSLHQDAIPDDAPRIFGVRSRAEFAALRRSELSPLQICRLNGLSRSHAQTTAEATLRATAARAVDGKAMPAAQAERLLARQLRQLPRWLGQTRYNGPPPVKSPRASVSTASNYSNNAMLSSDGSRVVFERYDAALASAKRRGEIGIVAAAAAGGAAALLTAPSDAWTGPRSDYNPSLSADGRWVAFESAQGNLNFAKRYGQMRVVMHDSHSGTALAVSHPAGTRVARSAYNPTVSGDGRLVAYEVYERPEAADGRVDVVVRDVRTGRTSRVPRPAGAGGPPSEPRLSADGRVLAFTALDRAGRSRVHAFEIATKTTRAVSAPGEEAWEPAISADGRSIAYTATSGSAPASIVLVGRDRRRARIAAPARGGIALEPSLSADGRRVAFVARPPGDRRTRVYVYDAGTRGVELVSRGDGAAGAPSMGSATHPSISGDGRFVAFTSDAWDLSATKCNSARGVFIRDLARHTTRLISRGDGRNRYRGPTKGSSTESDAFITLLCA